MFGENKLPVGSKFLTLLPTVYSLGIIFDWVKKLALTSIKIDFLLFIAYSLAIALRPPSKLFCQSKKIPIANKNQVLHP